MGFLKSLLGYVPPEQPPEMQSILPNIAKDKLKNGVLPNITAGGIVLVTSEVCHYVDVAVRIIEKKRYKSSYNGASIRVLKGVSWRLGESESVPLSEPSYKKGLLYITNKRVVFVAKDNAFDKKIKALTAVTSYSNGLMLQFGGQSYTILLPEASLATNAIDLLVR